MSYGKLVWMLCLWVLAGLILLCVNFAVALAVLSTLYFIQGASSLFAATRAHYDRSIGDCELSKQHREFSKKLFLQGGFEIMQAIIFLGLSLSRH
jgi:hypothetical protein